MRRLLAKLSLVLAVGIVMALAPSRLGAAALQGDTLVLQGLDKVTARVSTFDARVGQVIRFGTLEIHPRYCKKTPPEEPPETTAFIDIYEARAGEKRSDLFHGWMFSSSPALNALEHPVYDVWVLDCKAAGSAARSSRSRRRVR